MRTSTFRRLRAALASLFTAAVARLSIRRLARQAGASIVQVVLGLGITALGAIAAFQAFTGASTSQDSTNGLQDMAQMTTKAHQFKVNNGGYYDDLTADKIASDGVNVFGNAPTMKGMANASATPAALMDGSTAAKKTSHLALTYTFPSQDSCKAAEDSSAANLPHVSNVQTTCTAGVIVLTVN